MIKIKVDDELKQLFRGIELPRDMLDIEKELQKNGMRPATNTAKRRAAQQVQGVSSKPKQKKKKHEINKRTKLTNVHLPELFQNLNKWFMKLMEAVNGWRLQYLFWCLIINVYLLSLKKKTICHVSYDTSCALMYGLVRVCKNNIYNVFITKMLKILGCIFCQKNKKWKNDIKRCKSVNVNKTTMTVNTTIYVQNLPTMSRQRNLLHMRYVKDKNLQSQHLFCVTF